MSFILFAALPAAFGSPDTGDTGIGPPTEVDSQPPDGPPSPDYVVVDNSSSTSWLSLFPNPGDRPTTNAVRLDTPAGPVTYHAVEVSSPYPGAVTWIGRGTNSHELAVLTKVGTTVEGGLGHFYGGVQVSVNEGTVTMVDAAGATEEEEPSSVERNASGVSPLMPSPFGPAPMMSQQSSSPPPTGPYTGRTDLLDVLIVIDSNWGPSSESQLIAKGLTAIAESRVAFEDSGIDAGIRVVGIEDVAWETTPTATDTCDARNNLSDGADGVADIVHTYRDTYGADLVFGVIDDELPQGGAGCAFATEYPDAATTAWRGYFTVEANNIGGTNPSYTPTHEIGHALGVHHEREDCDNSFPNYACGYNWPDPLEVAPTYSPCPGEPFRSVNSRDTTVMIGTNVINTPRINKYSGLSVAHEYPACSGPPDTLKQPTGSTVTNSDGEWTDAARRINETLPEVLDYRPANAINGGAELILPLPGATITSTNPTFEWNAASPVGRYWLEVYDPGSGTSYHDALVTNTSIAVPLNPSTRIAVRLWTDMSDHVGQDRWTWVDHRFNTAGVFTSCSADELPTDTSGYSGYGCGGVCTESSGTITCDTSGLGSADTTLFADANMYEDHQPYMYDVTFYGRNADSSFYCCHYHDPDDDVSSILILGTGKRDFVYLDIGDEQLESWGQTSLDVEVRGFGGNDFIRGSNETDTSYSEYLRGYNGHDTIYGNAGNDDLGGGFGGDFLDGGVGIDTLWAGNDTVVDDLYGGYGFNFLCTADAEDLLVGANTYDTSSAAQLYISSSSPTGTPNAGNDANTPSSVCGHSSFGSGWGSCGGYSLAAAPAPCAALGAPN